MPKSFYREIWWNASVCFSDVNHDYSKNVGKEADIPLYLHEKECFKSR